MKKLFILTILITSCLSLCKAQGFDYDDKIYIGNDLYKVKSGEYYGIIDKNDNVVVSIEFQDILFKDGKALLTKDDILHGTVDLSGKVHFFETLYKVHPRYRYLYEGYIIVGTTNGNAKWGYITEEGTPLRIKSNSSEIISFGKKHPSMFDAVAPFVDGYAAVCLKKSGWKHIDKFGTERFVIADKKVKALYRSSVYKGECIIVTDDGIKQYQENNISQAVVKRVLASSATDSNLIQGEGSIKLAYKEGTLTLDSLMRVYKFETSSDSIVFIDDIENQKNLNDKKQTDTLNLKEDLKVELVYKDLQANEKGKAYTEIKLTNTSNIDFEDIYVHLECAGATREWNKSLSGKSEVNIYFNVPARFSSATIRRNILINIHYKNDSIKIEHPVIIKRYTPVRSL